MNAIEFDVAVIGSGVAGACAAALLAQHARLQPARVLLIGAALPPAPPAGSAPQARVIALSRASEHILRSAQAWARLDIQRLCAYERMRVWHESVAAQAESALMFDAAAVGEPNLGWIAEHDGVVNACVAAFTHAGGSWLPLQVKSVHFDDSAAHIVCDDGSERRVRLLVGADGAQSPTRLRAGIEVRTRDYGQVAVVANVHSERPHQHTAWQRFLQAGPLALLPLFDGGSSIVWSTTPERARELAACEPATFEQQLQLASDGVLGAFTLQSDRFSFPLHSVAARSYVAERCALIGDAAHVVHPLAGQGANLGLLDAAALCEAVATAAAEREDPGALRILRRYETQRRTHNLLMDAAMSALQGVFTPSHAPGSYLLQRTLALANRSALLKRTFTRYALGIAGELPRLARAG